MARYYVGSQAKPNQRTIAHVSVSAHDKHHKENQGAVMAARAASRGRMTDRLRSYSSWECPDLTASRAADTRSHERVSVYTTVTNGPGRRGRLPELLATAA